MTTFKRLVEQTERQIKKLKSTYNLPSELIEKLLYYARSLPKPGTNDVDELVFLAQMSRHFKLTSQYLLKIMYDSCKAPKSPSMTIEEYCAMLCTFISSDLNRKIKFTFNVYDVNKDGNVSMHEMYTLLRPCVGVGEDNEDAEEGVKDLIDLILKMTDTNNDDNIDLEEFTQLVKENILYLELFGPCLPADKDTRRFVEKLNSKTLIEVKAMFYNERFLSLGDLTPKLEDQLYPIPLDLP